MGFFNTEAWRETAKRNPAKQQATIGEAASAAWNIQRDQRRWLSAESAIYDKYEEHRRLLQSLTGELFFNPYTPSSITQAPGRRDRMEALFFEKVDKVREAAPELNIPAKTPESIRAEIAKERQEQQKHAADVDERSQGFLANAAGFLGTAGSATVDPPILMSMFVGLGWSAGVLRGALVDAGVGIVAETAVQAKVQVGRQEFGEDPSLTEAAVAVGSVGVGGFALSGALRGGVKGTKALIDRSRALSDKFRTPEVRGAEKWFERYHELQDANPFPDTPQGRLQHQTLVDEALARLTQTDTAVGRVLNATQPQRVEIQVDPIRVGEPAEAFFARVRMANPELFGRFDAVAARIETVNAKLAEIRAKLEQPFDTADAEQLARLKEEMNVATDNRKVKRLNRRIAELEKRSGTDIEKKAKRAKAQEKKLATQEKKLTAELKTLEAEQNRLTGRVNQAIQKLEPTSRVAQVARIKVVIGPGNDPTSVAARDMADFGGKVAEAVQRGVPDGPARDPNAPISPAANRLLTPNEQADIKVREEALEVQTREMLEADPEARFETTDADGNVRIMTAREMLDDLAEDEAILKELQGCAAGALV